MGVRSPYTSDGRSFARRVRPATRSIRGEEGVGDNMTSRRLLILGVLLILLGGFAAWLTQTAGGIRLLDVRFVGSGGVPMSALLYIPPNATAATPAPGILAVHGYFNSREAQD